MWKYSCWRQFQLIVRYFKVKVNYGYFKIPFNEFENSLTCVDENVIILTSPQFLNKVSVNPLTIDFGFTHGANDPNRKPEMALNGIKKHYEEI